jgi:hypothetical protein
VESASEPQTLQEAIVYFANPDNWLNYLAAKRWSGVTCPTRGSAEAILLASQRRWKCRPEAPATPVQRQGWKRDGGFPRLLGQVAPGYVAGCKLQERRIVLRSLPRHWHHPEIRMVPGSQSEALVAQS